MAVIKVAIAGLSSKAATSWASRAHLPYLLSPRGRAHYEIVALLNSSEDAARAAIAHYDLPATTRAYGDPAVLAADIAAGTLDVNLVTIATRVDVHYPTLLPSLQAVAKKATAAAPFGVLVEWPLADNLAHIRELADLAASNPQGIRTAVGLQGRLSPVYLAVREVVASGRLGTVLSSEVRAFGGSQRADAVPVKLGYFLDRSIGGNVYTIGFGHLIDSTQYVLGELQDVQPQFQLQYPKVKLVEQKEGGGETVVDTIRSDVPDLITVVSRLTPAASPPSVPLRDGGATLQARFRRGAPFPGETAYTWSIYGDKAELRLAAAGGPGIQAYGGGTPDGPDAITLTLHDHVTGDVTTVPWHWADWQKYLDSVPSRNIGALYEAYAEGREADYVTFADALARHEQLEAWLQAFKE
ncbi:oxidoreductase family protein [Niveomyces insectorum RCEF 264]|uniref:Oxidoreductase family protein n=1 Tax=Niveomyces insectorum RCEF 264 TaxID=1081102 RepID=A0A162MKR0_9HYPO|nr:oxidoreductase family protein [Niveomyces insectorum RCEF 264]